VKPTVGSIKEDIKMKITKDEFKELVNLYDEVNDLFSEYRDYISENLLNELLFPVINWIEEKLGINYNEDEGETPLLLAISHNNWKKENGMYYDERFLDLDLMYKVYIPLKYKE
jgi:hypothetical protein